MLDTLIIEKPSEMKWNKSPSFVKSAVLVILLVIVAVLIFLTPSLVGKKSFMLTDKCGRFMNLISHTINSEETCKARCRAQCDADGYRYDDSIFTASIVGCNSCKCNCAT